MFPDLIDLGILHMKTYGACMAVGFLICWTLIEKLSGRKDLGNLVVSLMISGVVGSRIAYVIEHWHAEFAQHPEMIIRVDQGGLMFFGGLILSIVVFFAWCLITKEKILLTADLLTTVIPLGHAFGRLGCFCFGCCYGKESSSVFAVRFPAGSPASIDQFGPVAGRCHLSHPVLPTQLFEAIALFALFAILYFVYRKYKKYTAAIYLSGYAVIRFGIEYMRGDPRAAVGPFSISQFISLLMIVLGVVFFEFTRRYRRG